MSEEKQSKWKGCLQIFLFLALIGYIVEQCESSSCEICGDYSYNHFETSSAFSDSDLADMIGEDKIDDYKKRLESEPSMVYSLQIDRPEELDDGGIRAEVYLGIGSKIGDVYYKGKIVTIEDDDTADGMLRIEYRYNSSIEEFEQITFSNDQNILFYDKQDGNLVLRNGNSSEYGLSNIEGYVFEKE